MRIRSSITVISMLYACRALAQGDAGPDQEVCGTSATLQANIPGVGEPLAVTAEAVVGKIYRGKVVGIKEFGAFVEIMPDKDGLLHISEIAWKRLETVEEAGIKEGDTITVKLLEIDEKTGEETKEPKHTVMFLARIDKKFQIYISSSKVLAETIGNYDLETCAAIEITYLGRKGAVGKKAGMWSVDALPMNLFDHEHLLPENMKPIMNMARNMKRMQIEKRAKIDALMSATTEKNGYAEITHDGD